MDRYIDHFWFYWAYAENLLVFLKPIMIFWWKFDYFCLRSLFVWNTRVFWLRTRRIGGKVTAAPSLLLLITLFFTVIIIRIKFIQFVLKPLILCLLFTCRLYVNAYMRALVMIVCILHLLSNNRNQPKAANFKDYQCSSYRLIQII